MLNHLSLLPIAQANSGSGGIFSLLPFILLFAGMWFLIIAPQRKRQKAHDKMLTELKSGDQVITNGGLHATITGVKEDRFVAKIAEGTKVEIGKSYVAARIEK